MASQPKTNNELRGILAKLEFADKLPERDETFAKTMQDQFNGYQTVLLERNAKWFELRGK
jgi:hypothetical protein